MGEYTPTTSEVMAAYVIGEHLTNPAFPVKETEACFHNWLEARDSEWQQRIRDMGARNRGLACDYDEQYRRADDANAERDALQFANDAMFASITQMIVDLDNARAEGRIYTYGSIQSQLRQIRGADL